MDFGKTKKVLDGEHWKNILKRLKVMKMRI